MGSGVAKSTGSGRDSAGEATATIIAHDPRMVETVKLLERLAGAASNVSPERRERYGEGHCGARPSFLGSARTSSDGSRGTCPAFQRLSSRVSCSATSGVHSPARSTPRRESCRWRRTARYSSIKSESFRRCCRPNSCESWRIASTSESAGPNRSVSKLESSRPASADLEQAVERELFRRDLFHRLGVFWIRLPPLRERADDIMPLAEFFLQREVERRGRAPHRLSGEVEDVLRSYTWPGNVRELKGGPSSTAL